MAKFSITNERGQLLVQTMVMTIILGIAATTLLKWSFGRYMVMSKVRSSVEARTYIESCMANMQATWGRNSMPNLTGSASLNYSCTFGNVPQAGENVVVNVVTAANYQNSMVVFGVNIPHDYVNGGQFLVTYTVNANTF
jgi:hypothetical protein